MLILFSDTYVNLHEPLEKVMVQNKGSHPSNDPDMLWPETGTHRWTEDVMIQ